VREVRKAKAPAAAGAVTVRMYNVGFGDSFLLTFPAQGRPRKVLVDCGSHAAGPGPEPMSDVARRIVKDVTESDGVPRIDVVVATHRHRDHVSGFQSPVWKEVEVTEVFLPWTENPADPDAKKIRDAQSGGAARLHAALTLSGAADHVLDLVANSLTNEKAMSTLHSGFSGNPLRRFLPLKGQERKAFSVPSLPGVTIHTLGPSRDPDVMRGMDPPQGKGYLRLPPDARGESAGIPFRRRWALSPSEFDATSAFGHLRLPAAYRGSVDALGEDDDLAVAVALDAAVNGTSLMLMFEIGRAFLLFPGDAEWGTWNALLTDPDATALLKKTVFYKVGHHGSHNATPKEFVEKDLSKFSAMVSTRPMSNWKLIPKKELLDALRAKSKAVVRSDQLSSLPAGFTKEGDAWVETSIPV
jgi:beta-lactamase superfamily II metal-dependent hydrolase